MKRLAKRSLAILLSLIICISMVPMSVFADETTPESVHEHEESSTVDVYESTDEAVVPDDTGVVEEAYLEDVPAAIESESTSLLQEEYLEVPETNSGEHEVSIIIEKAQTLSATSDEIVHFQSIPEAGIYVRDGLINRTLKTTSDYGYGVTIAVPVEVISSYNENQDVAINEAVYELWKVITEHTGEPTGGDYILRNTQGYSSSYQIDESGTYYNITIIISYVYSHQEANELDSEVHKLLEELDIADKSDYEKVRAIFDWMCFNITYDHTYTYYDAYSALCRRTVVCQGYASLFYRLCLEVGVDCRYCGGYAFGGKDFEGHGWNVVEMDGSWYYVDTTWGAGLVNGEPDYYYLLKGIDGLGDHLIVPSRWEDEIGSYCSVSEIDYPIPEKTIVWYEYSVSPTLVLRKTKAGEIYLSGSGVVPSDTVNDAHKVIVGEGITSLETNAIFGVAEVVLPDSLESISERGINNYQGTQIHITASLKSVSGGVLGRALNKITVSSTNPYYVSVDGALYTADLKTLVLYGRVLDNNGVLLEIFDVPEGVEIIGVEAFSGCVTLKEIHLPDTVTKIENRAFANCQNAQVNLTDNITYVGAEAFWGCNGLESIYIGDNLSQIGENALNSCNLKTIEVSHENEFYAVIDNVLFSADMTKLIKYPNLREGTEYTVPDGVEEIVDYAFEGFYSTLIDGAMLEKIVMPESVKVIGHGAFSYQTHLIEYNLPSRLEYIGDGAFASVGFHAEYKRREIVVPDNVEYIGDNAFRQNQFNNITIGANVNHIGYGAFECNELPSETEYAPVVYFRGSPPQEMTHNPLYITFGYNPAFSPYSGDRVYASILYPREYKSEWAPNDEIVWTPTADQWDRYPMGCYYQEGECCFEGFVTMPTCDAQGYVTYVCSLHGESFTDNYVDNGHCYREAGRVDAVCDQRGSIRYECICGDTYYEIIPALEHTYTNNKCLYCGSPIPPIVKISALGGKLQLTWNEIDGVKEYRISRAKKKNAPYTLIETCSGTSWIDNDSSINSNYCYYIIAVGTDGKWSVRSNEVSRDDILPEVAITGSNVASSGKIKLTWNKVDNAEKYEVYRSTSKTGTYSKMYTTANTSYTNTSAKAGTYYYYYVVAVHADGTKSESSNVVGRTCDLARPTTVTLSNVASSGKIKVSWTEVEGAAKYQVYRSTTKNGTYTLQKTTAALTWTDGNSKAGKTYYYKIKAVHSNTSANSALTSYRSRMADLARPATVTMSNVASTGKVKISWTKVDGAAKYQVYRATSKTGTYSLKKTTTSLSWTDTNTTAGKTYYYKVKAVHSNTNANSALTSYKSRTCDLKRPTVSITRSSGKPKVSWTAVSGATKYKIYRSTSKTGTYSLVKTTTSKYWKDTTAKKGKTYYYKVVAVHSNTNANSAYSTVVSKKCTK